MTFLTEREFKSTKLPNRGKKEKWSQTQTLDNFMGVCM